MMRAECYAASRPQEGRSTNEDAFVIGRGAIPYAALCDGAGNAQLAAKRALSLFDKLVQQANPEQAAEERIWSGWIKLLDSALLGGTQSTFLGVALLEGVAIGASAGDSRAYLIDREGGCRNLTEGARKYRLGSGEASAFAIRQPLGPGDILLLLSDGAWTPLGPYLLKKAVLATRGGHFSEVPPAVLDAAGRTGRLDDMTAIAVRVVR